MKTDEKMGCYEIFNEGNHYDYEDCHPQYVSKRFTKILPLFSDASKPFYALAYPRVYNDDICIYWKAFIYNVDNGEISSADVEVKINVGKITDDSSISAKVNVKNAVNFNNSIHVSMANLEDGKVFYIYLKQSEVGKKYAYQILVESSTRENRYSYDVGYGATYRSSMIGTNLINHLISYKSVIKSAINSETPLNIKLIGDSIVSGQGGSGFDNTENGGGDYILHVYDRDFYSNVKGFCWANMLKDYLYKKFKWNVKNYGVSGIASSTINTTEYLNALVKDDDDIIILSVGSNDRIWGTPQEFYKRLESLYNNLSKFNKPIILISSMPSSVKKETDGKYTFHAEDIDNMYMKLSLNKNIEYISMFKEMKTYCNLKNITVESLLSDDGLHPNDNGYEVMFNLICDNLGIASPIDGSTW